MVRAPLPGKVLEIAVAAGEYRTDTSALPDDYRGPEHGLHGRGCSGELDPAVHEGRSVSIRVAAYPQEEFPGTCRPDRRHRGCRDPDHPRPCRCLPNPAGRFRPDMFGEIQPRREFPELSPLSRPAPSCRATSGASSSANEPGAFEPVTVTFGKQRDGTGPSH